MSTQPKVTGSPEAGPTRGRQADPPLGGENRSGGLLGPPPPTRFAWLRDPYCRKRDLRLIRRAIRRGWPIPEEDRKTLVEELARLAEEEGAGNREIISIAQALMAMERANLDATRVQRPPNPPTTLGAGLR